MVDGVFGKNGKHVQSLVMEEFKKEGEIVPIQLHKIWETIVKEIMWRAESATAFTVKPQVQLMECGEDGDPGISVLLLVVEGYKEDQEIVPIQLLRMVEATVED